MLNEIYDIVGLAKGLELECEDITDLYISYIAQIGNHCENLRETFSKKDFIELKSRIHNVKGVAVNLNIQDVFEEAKSLERLLNQDDYICLKEDVERLSNVLIHSKDKVIKSFSNVNLML